ncbi:hypothetical protein OC25_05705 [Pedobacter kyungheensis]|uniref:TonB-dependent receptor plug domain-containing protein n=1 Tax=Pedobacter kyungheensis TaxID=1069985 RepID=A0A0C1FU53_9SPHI|nr:TonB-dependent receptor plug domain-containing protein [Pedobacter kyungheensis]KIA95343.1 hypothetical protein OC25_05705 [Pedobacter kyungheensis]
MKKIIVFTIVMGFTLAGFAQKADSTKTTTIRLRSNAALNSLKPLIVIDGNKQYSRDINLVTLAPDNIESVRILKDSSAVSAYGADGLAGVIEIKTKTALVGNGIAPENNINAEQTKKAATFNIKPAPYNLNITETEFKLRNGSNAPLYIVDGEEIKEETSINQSNIQSIEVLKDTAAKKLYGAKGNNGVIIIKTKNAKPLQQKN